VLCSFAKANKHELHADKREMESALMNYEKAYKVYEVQHPDFLDAEADVEGDEQS
jgi:hypothetical protein